MNIPAIRSYEEQAIDTVVAVINAAKEKVGMRQTLKQLANSRDFACNLKLSMRPIKPPYAISSEKFINDTIKKHWKLGKTFKYFVRYMGGSRNETSQYYYFEAIFSQPTVAYPIPQATVSVFFTLEDKHVDPPEERGVPMMWFRIEGQHTDHDMRYVALPADWILAVIKMKIKLFERIESIRMF
ncbi:hypothetical protein PYW07_005580 [Mythimna separata]|uniref:Uncharacterized protein n=1 Tax=Mythimna separata TaxID=271217 RepID=A0AAD7YJR8_MYTSE|nr:hypothetical protein PYW07_005580 [Mythimna separata]